MILRKGGEGILYCIDIQEAAINNTKTRMFNDPLIDFNVVSECVHFYCQSHENFPSEIRNETVGLINYNLGFLPTPGFKNDFVQSASVITTAETTIQSLRNALNLVRVEGIITIISYRGHPGGYREYEAIDRFCKELDQLYWRVYSHVPCNRPLAPVAFSIYKIKSLKNI